MTEHFNFSQARLKLLHELLDRLEKGKPPQEVLLDNADFQRYFRISRKTAYRWRRKKLIKFLIIEKKVFYRLSALREFLERQEAE